MFKFSIPKCAIIRNASGNHTFLPLTRYQSHFHSTSLSKNRASESLNGKNGSSPPPSSRRHYERRLLKYSTSQVYDIVSDVTSYSSFVPWCKESKIVGKNGNSDLQAELVVGFGIFKEKYISDVQLSPNSIIATSREADLLEYLRTEWTFSPSKDVKSCWVTFRVDFKFKSVIYNQISDLFLREVIDNMVVAFEKRCDVVYSSKKMR